MLPLNIIVHVPPSVCILYSIKRDTSNAIGQLEFQFSGVKPVSHVISEVSANDDDVSYFSLCSRLQCLEIASREGR